MKWYFVLLIILGLLLGGCTVGCVALILTGSSGSIYYDEPASTAKSLDELAKGNSEAASGVTIDSRTPDQILGLFEVTTQLQQEDLNNELSGKYFKWDLEIYEVKEWGDEYEIMSCSSRCNGDFGLHDIIVRLKNPVSEELLSYNKGDNVTIIARFGEYSGSYILATHGRIVK